MMKLLLAIIALAFCITSVRSQADMNNSLTIDKMPIKSKAIVLADYLMNHPDLFRKLEKMYFASAPIRNQGSQSPQGKLVLNAALEYMPVLLASNDFLADFSILQDELSKVNLTDVMMYQKAHNLTNDDARIKQRYAKAMFARTSKLRLLRRMLMRKSFRDRLMRDDSFPVTDQCYNDTMDFLDSMVGIQIPDPTNPLNFTSLPWAIKMFDAMGKPSGGITKGNLYFVGSYDLCMSIHAHIPAGILIANKTREKSRDFNTKFCRASFNLPESIVSAMTDNVDTRGVKLRINWGLCLPSSCSSTDVYGLLSLGPLAKTNLTGRIYKVSCVPELDLKKDTSALVTTVILGMFIVITIFTTILEGVTVWLRSNCKTESEEDNDVINDYEMKGLTNAAFVSNEKSEHGDIEQTTKDLDIPSGYVEHRNDKGLPEHDYTSLSKAEAKDKSDKDYAQISETKVTSASVMNGGQSSSDVVKVDRAQRPPLPSLWQRLMKAFSLYYNVPKLLNCKKSPTTIHCIHGIRFFSIMWIILGHTYNYGVLSITDNPTTANLVEADNLIKDLSFQAVQAGDYAVDTFFMISGMLVTWLTLKDLAKNKLSAGYLGQFYFHRFWRLTPIYMFVLAGFSCLYSYLGSGPLWPDTIKAADICKVNWWTNLLYINNIVRVDDMCMGWSWYLSDEMQFYVFSPLFIIPMYYIAPLGISLTVLMMFGGITSSFYKEYIYGGDLFQKTDKHYWNDVYVTPWCRVSAWCVGMLLGFVLYKFKKAKLRLMHALIGWSLAIGTGLMLCYVTYDYRKADAPDWPRWATSFREAFGRPMWAICVAWVVYACHKGRGAIINSILSFGGLIPLSRLTYAAYLVHPIMMIIYVFSKRTLVYISDFDIAYLYMGHVCTTYMAAFALSMIFESPFLSLEKILLQRGGH